MLCRFQEVGIVVRHAARSCAGVWARLTEKRAALRRQALALALLVARLKFNWMSESSSRAYRLCSVIGSVISLSGRRCCCSSRGAFVRRGMGAANREERRPKAPGIWHLGRCVTCVWLVVMLKLLSGSAVLVFAVR